jgi:TonB family protein
MKLKVMKAKPKLTDEEIQSYMDFEGLIAKHKSTTSFFTKGKITSLFVAIAVVATVSYFLMSPSESPTSDGKNSKNQIQNQIPGSSNANKADSKLIANDPVIKQKIAQKIEQPKNKQVKTSTSVSDQKAKPEASTAQPGKDVFIEAEPIDGFPKLYNFLNQNLKYPESNLKDKIEGVEIISFTIDESGNVSNSKVVQSLGKSFDEEAMRLINAMPKWKAATLNSRPVPSKLSLPFTFSSSK